MQTLYKVADVAEMLNISISYLYKKAEAGTIGSVKIGSALRFTEKQVNDYIEKCKKGKSNESIQ